MTATVAVVLVRLAAVCHRRRWVVLALWVVALVAVNLGARAAGSAYSQNLRLPDADSQQAQDIIRRSLPQQGSSATGDIVFRAPAGLADPAVAARLSALFDQVAAVEGVSTVVGPLAPEGTSQRSADGTTGWATVRFDGTTSNDVPQRTVNEVRRLAEAARADDLQVETGSGIFGGARTRPGSTEALGILAAVVILLIAFGSVLAMGLPILTALFGMGVGLAVVQLLAHVMSVPDLSTQLAAMIGIGVGIDYALFIVTRYRGALHDGLAPEAAVREAIDTAGRAVLFAGATVVIALAGMVLIGIEFIAGLGLAAASVVLVTMVASLTLLPAVLGFVGTNVDRFRIPGVGRKPAGDRTGFWFRWSRMLQRRPWPAALAGLAVLLVLAAPVLDLRLGSSDASNLPTTSTVRRAYDLKAAAQGAGASAPLLVVAEVPAGTTAEALAPVARAVADAPGVHGVTPVFVTPAGDAAGFRVTPDTAAQDPATSELIRRLRADVLPAATADLDIDFHVGGNTATWDDLAAQLQSRLPVFIGVVLALSFLLLLLVFRSVLVPLKAVVMNLLSIAAAYGVLVAVFQWGWASDVLNSGGTGPIESFIPMMMFAILFGLSMDYEVFLLSRIKEEFDRTGDNSLAVADGLSHTARVITAAAAIMIFVFGGFIFGDNRVIKEFGLGLSVAIFIDATIVRMVLVPATMELLGQANWWFPRWLAWLPKVHIEASARERDGAAADVDAELAALVAEDADRHADTGEQPVVR